MQSTNVRREKKSPGNRKAARQEINRPQSNKRRKDGKLKFSEFLFVHRSLFRLGLDAVETGVYMFIVSHAYGTRRIAHVTARLVADALRVNKDTAAAAIKRLILLGLIEQTSRSHYRIRRRHEVVICHC
jgi:hypothetical protein